MTVESDVGVAANAAGTQTVRIPANLYHFVRKSYDSREKVLDWCIAITLVAVMAYVFRDQIRAAVQPDASLNTGRADDPEPNQDYADALPAGQRARADVYTYNLPPSRGIAYRTAPSGIPTPGNPSLPPVFP